MLLIIPTYVCVMVTFTFVNTPGNDCLVKDDPPKNFD